MSLHARARDTVEDGADLFLDLLHMLVWDVSERVGSSSQAAAAVDTYLVHMLRQRQRERETSSKSINVTYLIHLLKATDYMVYKPDSMMQTEHECLVVLIKQCI